MIFIQGSLWFPVTAISKLPLQQLQSPVFQDFSWHPGCWILGKSFFFFFFVMKRQTPKYQLGKLATQSFCLCPFFFFALLNLFCNPLYRGKERTCWCCQWLQLRIQCLFIVPISKRYIRVNIKNIKKRTWKPNNHYNNTGKIALLVRAQGINILLRRILHGPLYILWINKQ